MKTGKWTIAAAGAALICGCYKTVTVPSEAAPPTADEARGEGRSVEFAFAWEGGTKLRAKVERTSQMNDGPERRLQTEYVVEAEALDGELSAIEAIESRPDLLIRTRDNRVVSGGADGAGGGFLEYVAAANLGVRASVRVSPEGELQGIDGAETISSRQIEAMRRAAGRDITPAEERLLADSLKPSLLKSRSKADWSFWVESWVGQTMEVGHSYSEKVPLAWDTSPDDASMTVRVAAVEPCGTDRCARIEVVIETAGERVRRAFEERTEGSGVKVDGTFLRETHTLWTVPETLIPRRIAQERVVRARLTPVSNPEEIRHYRQTVRTETSFTQIQQGMHR